MRFSFWHRISPPKSGFGSDPHRDSNPGFRRERAMSLASRRWGLADGQGKILPDAPSFVKGFGAAV